MNSIEMGMGSQVENLTNPASSSYEEQMRKFENLPLETFDTDAAEVKAKIISNYESLMAETEQGN